VSVLLNGVVKDGDMNELALFAGAGGGLLASKLLGWNTVCAVEIGEYPRRILLQRQEDGLLEKFPIWDDVTTFDGKPWRGKIDVISGGFPCQDISSAGKCAGITGERSGLWKEFARIISEVRPRFVFAENSPLLRTRGLGTVLKNLDELGYDARWGVLGAGHFGGLHKRARMWVVAYPKGYRVNNNKLWKADFQELGEWNPRDSRKSDDVAHRVDRYKAVGNGQVPRVAAAAWNILMQ
jgi:DNA (cytosine-5)-methyltransferase 1